MNLNRRLLLTGAAAALAIPAAAADRRRMVITGHLGNIGSRLLPHYRESWDVVGIDKKEGPEFDLSEFSSAWADRLQEVHTVIHLAALASPGGGAEQIYRDNIIATSNLVEVSTLHKVRRIVFASSTHVCPLAYGHPLRCYTPRSPYGASKLFAEALLQGAALERGLPASVIRVGWVPPETRDTSDAAPWLQKILWRDAELRQAFNEGVTAAANFIQVG